MVSHAYYGYAEIYPGFPPLHTALAIAASWRGYYVYNGAEVATGKL